MCVNLNQAFTDLAQPKCIAGGFEKSFLGLKRPGNELRAAGASRRPFGVFEHRRGFRSAETGQGLSYSQHKPRRERLDGRTLDSM
jgi:hypothetical protein